MCLVNDCMNQDMSLKIKLTSVLSLCLITLCLLTTSITSVYDALSALNSSGPDWSMFHLYSYSSCSLCTLTKSVLNVALLPFLCVLCSMSWLFYYVVLSNSLMDFIVNVITEFCFFYLAFFSFWYFRKQ